MDDMQRNLAKIDTMAENDEICQLWKNCRESFREEFQSFADSQPEEIRNMLWGYADSSELLQQRKLILACKHMTFSQK